MNFIKENLQTYRVNQGMFVFIISVLEVIILVFIICLFFWFESIMKHIGIESMTPNQWTTINNLGYVFGILLLIIQISISNRRAKASEKTAEETLKSGVEQRYHNAVDHLTNTKPAIRIGAIYNLYHISQSTNTYDETIFDMFCAYLKRQLKEESQETVPIKERQIIIDKLFKVEIKERVLKNPNNINLTEADLTGINLTGIDLTGIDLSGALLDSCVFDKANLSEAKLPAKLTDIKSMNEVIMDSVNFSSSSELQGLQLKKASWKNAQVRYTDLSNANLSEADLTGTNLTGTNLTETDLTGVIGLTVDQLSKVKCLYNVKGLNKELEQELKTEKPKLFNKLKQG